MNRCDTPMHVKPVSNIFFCANCHKSELPIRTAVSKPTSELIVPQRNYSVTISRRQYLAQPSYMYLIYLISVDKLLIQLDFKQHF